ncbi:MAG: hypothetical protein AB7V13_30510 [Pseudorhodoplanes sp.]|uniref:hypothetical protein n=1 Tax=Pseudorhodoplanes sp. TaxID=1934341 RepID=UPI003D0F51C4
MIYVLAFFLPPLALLLNGQVLAAVFNALLCVVFLVIGVLTLTPFFWLLAPAHAMIAIYMRREDRKHRELVEAVEKHGPPPNWRP